MSHHKKSNPSEPVASIPMSKLWVDEVWNNPIVKEILLGDPESPQTEREERAEITVRKTILTLRRETLTLQGLAKALKDSLPGDELGALCRILLIYNQDA